MVDDNRQDRDRDARAPKGGAQETDSDAQDAMATVGRIAGGVAHDLNNFLTPIINYAELALEDLSQDDVLYYDMEQILEAARCAHGLATQLLTLCRYRAPVLRPVDWNQRILGARRLLRRLLREDVVIDYHLDDRLWPIWADPSQVDQILLNMAVNAQDAMPSGGTLVVETSNLVVAHPDEAPASQVQPGSWVVVRFSDTGVGMSDAVQERIFQEGFSTKQRYGTGIGLATVARIVAELHAVVRVRSRLGHGTAFSFYFPRYVQQGDADGESRSVAQCRGSGEKILVVDEDEAMRRVCTRILDHYGYHTYEAVDPADAVRLLFARNGDIDAMLVDVFSFCTARDQERSLAQRVRELFPHLRLLFTSSYDEATVRRTGLLPDDAVILAKPYELTALVRGVWALLH